jgi:hypothetical protein
MDTLIGFILGNFTLTFFAVGLVFAAVSLAPAPKPLTGPVIQEALFKWFLCFSIGASYLYNAVFHIFFGELAAEFIGWANSPFQLEVGFASLGFAAVGFLAAFRSFDLRLAAILGPALFLWGAAGGHIYQMITADNFAPGNAGVMFWTDVILPVVGFCLLWVQHRFEREGRSVAPAPRVARGPATSPQTPESSGARLPIATRADQR